MTRYIDVNCDLAEKFIGYGIWIALSAFLLYLIVASLVLLDSYSEDEKCFNAIFSQEEICKYDKKGNLNWDFTSKESTETFLFFWIVMFIVLQIGAVLFLNMIKEWIVLRCKE